MRTIHIILGFIIAALMLPVISQAQNKYIGVKQCGVCHRTEKQGKQLDIWQKSAHANAYKTLTTKEAEEIAKKAGLKKPAAESPECLSCHATGYNVDAKFLDKGFDVKDGVQCETCHGAGSAYKATSIMKDRQKSVEAGLIVWENDAEIEKSCITCHNEKSPTYKEFKFKEAWKKIAHPVPKGG